MDDGRELWVLWQSLLKNYAPLFRRGGWVRFVQWVTAMVQCGEEHTITQGLREIPNQDQAGGGNAPPSRYPVASPRFGRI